MSRGLQESFRCLASSILLSVCLALPFFQVYPAVAYDRNIAPVTRRMYDDTRNLVKQLKSFLQTNGRWVPKPGSKDMQVCSTMEELQNQTKALSKRGGSIDNSSLFRLQATLRSLRSQFREIGANRNLVNALSAINSNANQLQFMTQSKGSPANSGLNPTLNPALNPGAIGSSNFNRNEVNTLISKIRRDVDGLIKSLRNFLTTSGRWNPKPTGQDMAACETMHQLEVQARDLRGNNRSSLGSSAFQMRRTIKSLENQFRQIGVNGRVNSALLTVKGEVMQLNSLSGNGGHGWGRRWGGGNIALRFVSSRLVAPNLYSVTWDSPNGRQTFVSRRGSYILSDGVNARKAVGEERKILDQAYAGGI